MAKLKKANSSVSVKNPVKKVAKQTKAKKEQKKVISTRAKLKIADTLALVKSQQKRVSKQTKKIKKRIEQGLITIRPSNKKVKQELAEKRGLIYIGHIPHGFYEKEMQTYFKQFGRVTNVKVCRSRISGRSKGFGYIEFQHPEVAKIAADTMNNYVMFKKRIVTEYVPYEKRPKGLFVGKSSNLEHTSVQTRQGKQKYSKNKIRDDKAVEKKAKKTVKILQSKIEKLKTLGIKCSLTPVNSEVLSKKSSK